jgi:predicted AAA+ superfamily ATPase
MHEINWNDRLIGIKGGRGIGKTTLLLQYHKIRLQNEKALYVSLDDFYFTTHKLYEVAEDFYNLGGRYLLVDEVHRYPGWANEIKLLYDDLPDLKIIFTGSSILEISKARADLSRRAIIYTMAGLSFREYLWLTQNYFGKPLTLNQLITDHVELAEDIYLKVNVISEFSNYLKLGYYPFFIESPETYHTRLSEVLNQIIFADIQTLKGIPSEAIAKLRKLLYIISNSVPFKPNVAKLSELIQISRNSLVTYLNYLEEAQIINLLHTDSVGIGYLRKPEKIYMENTNLLYVLNEKEIEAGNYRETFFFNQLRKSHQVVFDGVADFLINGELRFEIGGKNKTVKQIAGLHNAYIAADNITTGFGNKIPLWLFGFLY